jgi:hypothetical protein
MVTVSPVATALLKSILKTMFVGVTPAARLETTGGVVHASDACATVVYPV